MNEFKSGIYKITINDFYIYIGQSVDIERRWNDHLYELKHNKHCNKKFQSVFNKHSDNIKFEIIEECNVDKLDEREMFYIEQFKSYNNKHGLNMSIGGDCGSRKYKTREEAEAAKKEYFKQYRQDNKEYLEVKFKQYYQDNKEHLKQYHKQWYQDNKDVIKEKIKVIFKQWYQDNKKQKGILSKKERFESRYNLSRPLTNKEWNIWRTDKSISGSHNKCYAIKFLKSLPNITFTTQSE